MKIPWYYKKICYVESFVKWGFLYKSIQKMTRNAVFEYYNIILYYAVIVNIMVSEHDIIYYNIMTFSVFGVVRERF